MNTTFKPFIISAPATSANLGSSFDCLGLCLSLFNHTTFSSSENNLEIKISGFGKNQLPLDNTNHIVMSMKVVADFLQSPLPNNINISCENNFPVSSGMGSSAAAALTGILAANKILDAKLTEKQIFLLGSKIEGHGDNLIAAYLGGLQLVIPSGSHTKTYSLPIANWDINVVTPKIELSTENSRTVLPTDVPLATATDAIGKSNLSIEAFRTGDAEKLMDSFADKLHQPHRLPLIPGATETINYLRKIGIPAVLSGAGPSLIAFGNSTTLSLESHKSKIQKLFENKNISYTIENLRINHEGTKVLEI